MTDQEYLEIGKFIWKNYVPKSGQADTVQGELLRANEKLRDEAQRNGNGNWDEGHEILAIFILKTLTKSKDLTLKQKEELDKDIDRVLDANSPYLEDDLYDRIERKIFDWYLKNKEPIRHEYNPELHR